MASIEADARRMDPIPGVFDQELVKVREQIRSLGDRFKGVRVRQEAIKARSSRIRDERWHRTSIDRFIGRIEQALKVLKAPQGNPAFAAEVAELKHRLSELRSADRKSVV
mgnify:FL=1